MLRTHSDSFKNVENEGQEEQKEKWSLRNSLNLLIISSTAVAFLSELLIGAAEAMGNAMGMSTVFVGVIFVAIVGAAGNIPSVTMASNGKMDLSIGIVMGSAIQLSLFVAPLLALLSLIVGPHQLTLEFSRILLIIIFLSVLPAAVIAGDGQSNWYKGVQLIIMYIMIALMFFFVPN
ncbi:MAG: hypothetical protein PSX36_02715 [bacterium]|nr:hypothetical protein [bacterium]